MGGGYGRDSGYGWRRHGRGRDGYGRDPYGRPYGRASLASMYGRCDAPHRFAYGVPRLEAVDDCVIVTCHEGYLGYLAACLDSIDAQQPGYSEKVVVLNRCSRPDWLRRRRDWRCARGDWWHVAPARNVGLAVTDRPWVQFMDADNAMPAGFHAARLAAASECPHSVGVLYGPLHYCDGDLLPHTLSHMPEYDYWHLRRSNFIDTSSLWRREALESVGGVPDVPVFEDWATALALTSLGWRAANLPDAPAVLMRQHGANVSATQCDRLAEAMWRQRSLAIVTLMAGRTDCLATWAEWLNTAELPPRTNLYLLDNTRRGDWRAVVSDLVDMDRFGRVTYQVESGRPRGDAEDARHRHIADLYNRVFPHIDEDLVLTLEDDVVPPSHGLRLLCDDMSLRPDCGLAAGAYAMRDTEDVICATFDPWCWVEVPSLSDLPPEPVPVGLVGGGFTLYANWALKEALPVVVTDTHGWADGWDTNVCRAMRAAGYELVVDGRVICEHRASARQAGR